MIDSGFEAFEQDAPYFSRVMTIREEKEWLEDFERQQMEWDVAVAVRGALDQIFPAPVFDGALVEDLKDAMGTFRYREWVHEDHTALENIAVTRRVNEKIIGLLSEGMPMPGREQRRLMLECQRNVLRGNFPWNTGNGSRRQSNE